MSDFFDGAVMAYRDCAELMRRFKKNVPPNLDFMLPFYDQCEESFNAKANEVIEQVRKAKNVLPQ